MPPSASVLRATPLHAVHLRMGAKMVDFGGWDMPLQYSGILDEHHAVRRRVGLFDVSHMGEIEIRGAEALKLVNYVTTNDASRLAPGQAQYSALLYEHGGFADDVLVYKVADHHCFLCVNAANQEKDHAHISARNRFDCAVENAGARWAQLAVQGPCAAALLQKLAAADLTSVRTYHFTGSAVCGAPARIARTGYTGEDGFELYLAPEQAPRVWDEILDAGAAFGIRPCGLGARNTLRLEAAMALYSHEIHATVTPWEANLGRIVKLDKGEFLGRAALVQQTQRGVRRRLCGFQMRGRAVARDGYEVWVNGSGAGWVTSAGPSPTLGCNIGLCYLPVEHAEPGRTIHVIVRGHPQEAVVVPVPFYRRPHV